MSHTYFPSRHSYANSVIELEQTSPLPSTDRVGAFSQVMGPGPQTEYIKVSYSNDHLGQQYISLTSDPPATVWRVIDLVNAMVGTKADQGERKRCMATSHGVTDNALIVFINNQTRSTAQCNGGYG